MKLWNKYNQCMEIATRCSKVFAKLFKIKVTNGNSLWINLLPISDNPLFNIHMVSDKTSDKLEVYINSNDSSIKSQLGTDTLDSIAYRLGNGIVNQYAIIDYGIIFLLDHNKEYGFYEDTYSFISENDTITSIQSDFPLLHHIKTDIELSTQLFYEDSGIKSPATHVAKNGVKMFDYDYFTQLNNALEINVSKIASNIDVQIIDHNFGRNNLFNVMSLLSSLPFYGVKEPFSSDLPTKIYLRAINNFSFEDGVQILSTSNQSLSKSDLELAILETENKLGFCEHRNWNKYLGV